MDILAVLQDELEQEFHVTKRFFELYDDNLKEYRPHPKNMTMAHLATHIAQIFSWSGTMLETDFLDLAQSTEAPVLDSRESLLASLDAGYHTSAQALDEGRLADLEPIWQLRHGDHLIAQWTVYGAIRHSLNQITHHRAQLGVYYRLNEIPLPVSYGPTADNTGF